MAEDGNVYCGRQLGKTGGAAKVWRNGKLFTAENSLKVRNHSPDGFQWGYGGSGPAQLALALLLDVLKSSKRASAAYQKFKFQVVGRFGPAWVLTQDEIERWYRDAKLNGSEESETSDEAEEENPSALAEEPTTSDFGEDARDRVSVLEEDHPRSGGLGSTDLPG